MYYLPQGIMGLTTILAALVGLVMGATGASLWGILGFTKNKEK